MKRYLAPSLVLALALAACAGAGTPDDASGNPVGAIPSIPAIEGVPEGMIEDVVQLAVSETGVARDAISIVTAEAVTWPDGSIGCPQDDMMYTQALVPGYRVILDVAGEQLAFHASQDGAFAPCANPVEPVD